MKPMLVDSHMIESAPRSVELRLMATLYGVAVAVKSSPSVSDPLGQEQVYQGFATLNEALEAVPDIIAEAVYRQASDER